LGTLAAEIELSYRSNDRDFWFGDAGSLEIDGDGRSR